MRDAATYRGARRNYCIRDQKMQWTPQWYYKEHRNAPRWFVDRGGQTTNNLPIYIAAERHETKAATSTNVVHTLLKRGDYGAAVRRLYG